MIILLSLPLVAIAGMVIIFTVASVIALILTAFSSDPGLSPLPDVPLPDEEEREIVRTYGILRDEKLPIPLDLKENFARAGGCTKCGAAPGVPCDAALHS